MRNFELALAARRGLKGTAMAALAAGVGVWGVILLSPVPGAPPPAIAVAAPPAPDIRPVVEWFGAGAVSRVKLGSSGFIAAGAASTAILSLDGGTPRAYAVGQHLAPDLVLAEVHPDRVVILQGARRIEVAAPRLPPVTGIVDAQSP